MSYDILIEIEGHISRLGWTDTKEEAQNKMLNYIANSELLGGDDYINIWIEEDKHES